MQLEDSILARDRDGEARHDPPLMVVVTLGVLAALLTGMSVTGTVRAGLTAVAIGFAIAVGVVLATVVVFELGRRTALR